MFTCSKCLEEKPTTEFHKNSRAKRGHDAACKKCRHSAITKNKEVSVITHRQKLGNFGKIPWLLAEPTNNPLFTNKTGVHI